MQPAPKRAKLSPPGSSSATVHPLLVEMSQCRVVPSAVRKLCELLISKDEKSTTDTLQLSQEALDLAWSLLRIFPRELLRRIPAKTLDQYYDRANAERSG